MNRWGILGRFGVRLTLGWLVVAILVFLLSKLSYELFLEGRVYGFDIELLRALRRMAFPGLTRAVVHLTSLGSPPAIGLIGLGLAVCLARVGRGYHSEAVLAVTFGSVGLNLLLKELFRRPRPHHLPPLVREIGFSYPSGHAMAAMGFYGLLVILTARSGLPPSLKAAICAALTLVVVGVGFSRMYLGVHYPTDVLAGLLAGGAWLAVVVGVMDKPHEK